MKFKKYASRMTRVVASLAMPVAVVAQTAPANSPTSADVNDSANEVVTLESFTVKATRDATGWGASEAVSGTRTASSIIDLPYSVSVLTREFMDDFQLKDLDEYGLFLTGFSAGEVEAGGGGGSRLRGFTPPNYRNGFQRSGIGEVMNVDRVEVIKGPLSALYGRSEPGGLVNYITKKAQEKPAYRASVTYGSYDFRRAEMSATGPVSDKLFYRVDVSHQDTEGNMDYYYQKTQAASTSWTYKFNPNTAVTVDLEYMGRDANQGTAVLGRMANVPVQNADGTTVNASQLIIGPYAPLINFNIFGPDALSTREVKTANVQFEHQINRDWSLRINGQAWEREVVETRWTSPQYQINTGLFNAREPYHSTLPQDSVALQADLSGGFRTGKIEHKVLATLDFAKGGNHNEDYRYGNGTGGTPNDLAALPASTRSIDPLNPNWVPLEIGKFTRQARDQRTDTREFGSFISDRVGLFDNRLIAMLGARFDKVDVTYTDALAPQNNTDDSANEFTYTAGLTWRIKQDRFVAFLNHSTSFSGNPIVDREVGGIVGFSEGEGIEAGVKGLSADKSLSYTFTVYEIERVNPAVDPDFVAGSGLPQYNGLRTERVRGVELDFSWKATKDLSLRGGISFLDSEVVAAPEETPTLTVVSVVGDRLLRTPDFTANLALSYRVPVVRGLSVGASISYTDEVITNYGNQLTSRLRTYTPSYALINGFVAYSFRTGEEGRYRHSVRLNGLNLGDKYYWTVTGREGYGFQVRGSYSLSF
jgi:iron complex outermembrane receptor protein